MKALEALRELESWCTKRLGDAAWGVAGPAAVCAVLIPLYLLCHSVSATRAIDLLNWAGPAAITLALVWSSWRTVAGSALWLLTPLPWLWLATAVFFGFGPLAYSFAGPETVAHMDAVWPVGREELGRTNLLDAVGILALSLAFGVGWALLSTGDSGPRQKHDPGWEDPLSQKAAVLFLAVGLPIKYGFVVPHDLGQLGYVLPGGIFQLQYLVLAGLLLLAFHSARSGGRWTAAFVVLLLAESALETLRLNKTALLLVPILAAVGWYLAKRRLRPLVACAAFVFAVYIVVTPFVIHARREVGEQARSADAPGLAGRFDIGQQTVAGLVHSEHSRTSTVYGWWARLSYANAQTFVMQQYDAGRAGTSHSLVLASLVPRLLWPEKPVLSDVGVDLTEAMQGKRWSSTGVGLFAEAYWNGGWLRVLVVSAGVGLLLAVLSWVALVWIGTWRALFLPGLLLGVRMGFRIDGWLVVDYVGAAAIYAVYLACLWVAGSVFTGLFAGARPSGQHRSSA